jgi:STE24 endopeptidase
MIKTYRRIPADPAEWFEPAEVKKAKDYQRPLNVARAIDLALTAALLAVAIFGHVIPRVADAMGFTAGRWVLRLVVTIVLFSIVGAIIDLPISIWTTFSHEKKWGFSTETPGGFVADQIKNLVLGFALTLPLLLIVWWLIRSTDLWWIYGWAVFFAFSALLGFLYPILIAPIFNKFTPLSDEALDTRLRALATSQGMRIKSIQVMDASKRTRKDNAYFAGFGKTKQIVLFDNLLTQTPAVIESIVGHEIGHWKRRHLVRGLVTGLFTTFALFWVLHFVMTSRTVLGWAGVKSAADSAAWPILFASFAILFPVLGLLNSFLSRAYERQADVFALDVTKDYDAFVETEHGLSTRNLIDLAPSWWRYVRLSHPPPAERLELGKLWKAENATV